MAPIAAAFSPQRFTYEPAIPSLLRAVPRSRTAYARDAFCRSVGVFADMGGCLALAVTGHMQDLRTLPEMQLRRMPAHRVGAALGGAWGCAAAAVVGAATWVNPVDAAHDVPMRSVLRHARETARRQMSEPLLDAWQEQLLDCMDAAGKMTGHESRAERVHSTHAKLGLFLEKYEDTFPNAQTPVGTIAMGLELIDWALKRIPKPAWRAPVQCELRAALLRRRGDFLAEATDCSMFACHDGFTGQRYSGDSPSTLRMKCLALAVTAPLVASLNVVASVVLKTGFALHAACVLHRPRLAATLLGQAVAAPLLGLGLPFAAATGILAPNLGRSMYAALERPMSWRMAPCLQPLDARRGLHHGLGGLSFAGTTW